MCDCSNYCQLLVGPRHRAPHRGISSWTLGVVSLVAARRPRILPRRHRREIARGPDLCNWRVWAGPRGVDEELRLPGARRPSL